MQTPMTPSITVRSYYYPPLDNSPGATALVVQVTTLINSYMIWVGSCEEISGAESGSSSQSQPKSAVSAQPKSSLADDSENIHLADLQLVDLPGKEDDPRVLEAIRNGRFSKDWACAMPAINPGMHIASTPLFRSNESDITLAMAQRLARRWKKQVFLSADLPPKFEQGSRLLLELEKRVLESIRRVEESRAG
ncbi:hypothetical protein FRB95_002320 [Tulasnella sp. JGI-2019a]|nr:hypothetical protein FRB95_002320 [Tulasnella sp. JGI-2019a]